jgi:hypothetical protein
MIILQKKEFALNMNTTQLDYSMLYTLILPNFSGYLLVRISARHPMEAPLAERRREEDSRRRASANGEG